LCCNTFFRLKRFNDGRGDESNQSSVSSIFFVISFRFYLLPKSKVHTNRAIRTLFVFRQLNHKVQKATMLSVQ